MLLRVAPLLLLLIAGCAGRPAPPAGPPAPPPDPAAWRYPGSAEVATVGASEIRAADAKGGAGRVVDVTPGFVLTTTPDPFEDVFAFYAKKLGVDPTYAPGTTATATTTPPTMTDTRGGVPPLLTGSIVHAGRPGRSGVKSATLVKHDRSGDVAVVVSRGAGEDLTTIELWSIGRAAP